LQLLGILLKFFSAIHVFCYFPYIFARTPPLNTAEDDILLWESFRKGDREAFATLFRNHYVTLYRYGGKVTTDLQLLEDCIQELFIELWKTGSRTTVVSVRSYLLKSLKYKLLRSTRKKRNTQLPMDRDLGFEWSHETFLIAEEESADRQQQVLKALEHLSPRQKEIVYLKYYQNLSYEEVSVVMSIKYQVARNLLYQAMKTLKKYITFSILLALLNAFT
jgi:RNA polymerase sigma factor (sigma-70 family)